MKLHQILAILTILAIGLHLWGVMGIAYGLETPSAIFSVSSILIKLLSASTVVTWNIGKIARAML